MKRIIFLITALLSSAAAEANGTGIITSLAVGRNGYQVFVQIDGSVDPLACRT